LIFNGFKDGWLENDYISVLVAPGPNGEEWEAKLHPCFSLYALVEHLKQNNMMYPNGKSFLIDDEDEEDNPVKITSRAELYQPEHTMILDYMLEDESKYPDGIRQVVFRIGDVIDDGEDNDGGDGKKDG
jgi:hypothetical protein